MVESIKKELVIRKNELNEKVETIYFGGGTPSILEGRVIGDLIDLIKTNFDAAPDLEITLEANPDDLSLDYLTALKETGVNRLSIGTQSFDDDVLKWMNRSHDAKDALKSIEIAKQLGFENITIDLIFGIPGKTTEYWQKQLEKAIELKIPHLSIYGLTVEPSTVLSHRIKKGMENAPDPDEQAEEFAATIQTLADQGYRHYEISNYAIPGSESRHNSAYWTGKPYLGIGPAAHSFDGESTRLWNVSNNQNYMKAIEEGILPQEKEVLEIKDRINEFILTNLRRDEGLDLKKLKTRFDHTPDPSQIDLMINKKWGVLTGDSLQLTLDGKLIADHLASELFVL